MNDVGTRAREAADRLRKAMESSPIGTLIEEQQRNLGELLGQVQNAELRARLSELYDQQQKMVVELARTVQTTVAAQQQHLSDALGALEDTLREQRAKVEEADPADDLTDDNGDEGDDEPPRVAPFAYVPGAQSTPSAHASSAGRQPSASRIAGADSSEPAAPAKAGKKRRKKSAVRAVNGDD